jgi:hypothetical protein
MKSAMMGYRFNGISRTGRVMAAMTGHKRTDGVLVNPDWEQQKLTHQWVPFLPVAVGLAGKLE